MTRPSAFTGSVEHVILEGAQRPKDLVRENRALGRVATGKVEEILRSTLQDDTPVGRFPCRPPVQMATFLTILGLGFLLGLRHATDADHVIAVTTLVTRERELRRAGMLGLFWGVGHTVTILLVGGSIILFRLTVPSRLAASMELCVAAMLIFLGIRNFITTNVPHRHAPAEGHLPASGWRRAVAVGVVHGLAGSAAIALLVLTTIRSPGLAVLYLVVFGTGTIAGMMLITSAVAAPMLYSSGRVRSFDTILRYSSGILSVAFGLFLAWQIAIA
ncbi:MAG: high-affinity nickel-transport family protein [Acidobacteriota bacterium]